MFAKKTLSDEKPVRVPKFFVGNVVNVRGSLVASPYSRRMICAIYPSETNYGGVALSEPLYSTLGYNLDHEPNFLNLPESCLE